MARLFEIDPSTPVALFVAGEAFTNPGVQGAAKMGAMLSIAAFPIALATARMLGIRKKN